MRLALLALILSTILRAPAGAQDAEPSNAESQRVAAWRAAVERVNERIRSSHISWFDGHLGVVSRIRMSPDGGRAVTWAQDGSAWLWNAWTGEPIGLLGMFGMGETSYRWPGARSLGWPTLQFSADGERILLLEPLAGFAGLWDGRSAEFLGHLEVGEEVACAATFSPDGRRIAVASQAGIVRFFDADSGLAIDAPVLEASLVDELSFSPDGSMFLALASNGRARLWNAKSGALLGELGSSDLPIQRADFSADSTRVLAVSPGGVALAYSTRAAAGSPLQPNVVRAAEGEWSSVDWSRTGTIASIADPMTQRYPIGKRLLAVGRDGTTALVDAETGRTVAPIGGGQGAGNALSCSGFSPDGERLLTFVGHRAQLWNAATGERIADLALQADYGTFSPGGRYFATGCWNLLTSGHLAGVYETLTGRLVGQLDLGSGSVYGLHFSDTQRLGATSAFGWATVWDGAGKPVNLDSHALQIVEEGLEVGLGRWSPDGVHALSSTWGRHAWYGDRLWDVRTGSSVRALATEAFSGGGFTAGGELISVLFTDGRMVTDVDDGGPAAQAGIRAGDRIVKLGGIAVENAGGITAILPRLSSKTTISVVRAGTEVELALELPPDADPSVRSVSVLGLKEVSCARIQIQDTRSGAVLRSVELEPGFAGRYFQQIVANRDASRLTVRKGVDVAVYDLTNGKCLARLTAARSKRQTTYEALLHLVAMSPRGDVVAVAADTGVRLWSETSGEVAEALPGAVLDLVFSPDGRLLAGAASNGNVLVWDVAQRKLVKSLAGHRGNARFVAFDARGSRIVSVGADGTARVWDLAGEKEALVLSGHAGLVHRPSFAPDGSRVLTTADDATARLWDASTGASIAVLEGHVGPVIHGEFSPDGMRILTQSRDGSTRIWNGNDGRLLATRVEYDDGWVMSEPGGSFIAGGGGAEHAKMVVNGRRYPLSSYAAIYASPEKVADSLAGKHVRKPSFVPQAPELRVASPLDPLVPERKFRLEVLIEDVYGIESVSVVQDGRPLDSKWIGAHLVASGKSARLSCDLALPVGANETTVKVRATNLRKIQSAPKTVFARWQPPQRDLYVLALGVADYQDDRLDLAYPVKDADDLIARFAAEQGGYYQKVHTQRLANAEVTPGRLHKAREEFLLRAQPDDTIVVFAAGHGVRSESGEYYFLTPGTTPDDPYDGIERQVLESLVTWDRLHAERRVLLLDTCHSGEAFGEGKRGLATDAFDQKTVNDAAGTGLYIIAASSERGFAQEMRGNGLFTRCLIEGLDGAADRNRDGFVGIEELKTYATAAVHERSGGRQRPTVPRIEGGEDFPLARRLEEQAAPK